MHAVGLTNIVILAVSEFTNLVTAAEASFAVVSVIVRSGTVVSVLYLGFGAGIVTPEVSVRNMVLSASIWRTELWFIVVVAWSHSVWVVVMDVGILGLIYCGI